MTQSFYYILLKSFPEDRSPIDISPKDTSLMDTSATGYFPDQIFPRTDTCPAICFNNSIKLNYIISLKKYTEIE